MIFLSVALLRNRHQSVSVIRNKVVLEKPHLQLQLGFLRIYSLKYIPAPEKFWVYSITQSPVEIEHVMGDRTCRHKRTKKALSWHSIRETRKSPALESCWTPPLEPTNQGIHFFLDNGIAKVQRNQKHFQIVEMKEISSQLWESKERGIRVLP